MKHATFGRLLKAGIASITYCEGKTAPAIESELGDQVGVASASIQRYKAGHIPPDAATIERLADACVRRGLMGRDWLQQFLQSAHYPSPGVLIEQLVPNSGLRPRPSRIYQNLPAPTYSQFVMRTDAFAEVLDGLGKRSAAVIIVGLGGNGKTSLAREIADYCLKSGAGMALFDAAIWVSDKDRPGTTNLSIVLDEIARTLDYPGFTQFAHDEKRREVEQLLRRWRVLVCVDNFETITDGSLLTWLLGMPEPSKALITTREYRREYRRGGWPVELRGMSEREALAFVAERLRMLRIEKLVSDVSQFDPLIAVTAGNPKAIELMLGLVKYERRPLQQIVDDLYAARGELFDDLFLRAWAVLDEAARRILLALTFFPASVSAAALSATADVQGFSFERALERLTDVALLDVQQTDMNSAPRYIPHPLVRVFATARLAEQPEFVGAARERWEAWHLQLVQRIGPYWYDMLTLAELDVEVDNLRTVVEWTYTQQRFTQVMAISSLLGYYYYVRGAWEQQAFVNQLRLDATQKTGNRLEEGFTLLNMIRIPTLQGDLKEAQHLIALIEPLLDELTLSERQRASFLHGIAMVALAQGEIVRSREIFQYVMQTCREIDPFKYNRARNWMAESLLQAGQYIEARQGFEASLQESQQIGYHRSVILCQVKLAMIFLWQHDLEQADTMLQASYELAHAYQDRRDLALIQRTYAQLHMLRGNLAAAQQVLIEAIDLFERLGMRRELMEAQDELQRVVTLG